MKIKVISPGMLTTVQDLGRFGYAHIGMSPAGAADARSFRVANLLVGNDENTPALEMTLLGPKLEFEEPAVIAITGAGVSGESAGAVMWQAIEVQAGFVLTCGPLTHGARAYLAVQGGFKVERQMHSASTHLASGVGGIHGRALKNGDILETAASRPGAIRVLRPELRELKRSDAPISVTRGLQWERFAPAAIKRFLSSTYTVSEQSNRAGLRLTGESVSPGSHPELLTEGIALGAVQTPPDGQPIILFVDQQTTGGYPKIANVIAADLHRIGQLRPRDTLRFQLVSIEEAVDRLRVQEKELREAFLP